MRSIRGCLLLSLVLASRAAAQAPANPLAIPRNDVPVAFVDVSVIPMDRERVIERQTVVVSGGRVAALGPVASVPVPAGATVVDGRGKFLMPGFADMHGHLQGGQGTLDDPAGQQLALTLAHGVTLFRSVAGAPTGVGLRERVKAGELLGPELVIFSASLNGNSVPTTARGVQLVEQFKQAGVDGLKTHGGFSSGAIYDSIVAAARRTGLKLAGHVTPEFGLMRAVEAGQQIEHLDGFLMELMPGYAGPDFGQILVDPALLARVDTTRIPALARTMAERGIWNGPTLALFETIVSDSTAEQLLARPNMRYVSANARASWPQQLNQERAQMGTPEGRRVFTRIRNKIVKALYDAGAHLMVGSDSPQFFIVPGDAVHREMAAFVSAGVPAYGALVAATRAPAEYLGRSDLGTLAVGKTADLVLLDGNPLQDINQTRRVSGVMVQGRWLDAVRVRGMLDAVASKNGN